MSKTQGYILPTHDEMVENILTTYEKATDTQLIEGAQWYNVAHALAAAIHDDINAGAAIIAVLSPATNWASNAPWAVVAARKGTRRPSGPSGDNWRKAKAARRKGANLDDIVRGPKVRDFWTCIATNGTDTHAVCVDRHAAAIAVGRFLGGKDDTRAVSGFRYNAIADAYRDAAARIGILPNTLQAVTWTVWRDTPWRQRPSA